MFYKHIAPPHSTKGTIVCIHGNSSASSVFQSFAEKISDNYAVLLMDLPGHGSSKHEDSSPEDFYLKTICSQVLDLINSLEDEVILMGNSLGGNIAMEIAKDVKRLKGIIISSVAPLKHPLNLEEAMIPIEESRILFSENATASEIDAMAEKAVFDKNFADVIANHFIQTDPKVRTGIVASAIGMGQLTDEYEIFTKLHIPKIMVIGKNDPSMNMTYLEHIKNTCTPGSCQLIVLKNCGHYPALEQPEQMASITISMAEKVFR